MFLIIQSILRSQRPSFNLLYVKNIAKLYVVTATVNGSPYLRTVLLDGPK